MTSVQASAASAATTASVNAVRDEIGEKAHRLIHESLPAKIIELTQLATDSSTWKHRYEDDYYESAPATSSSAPADKKRKLNDHDTLPELMKPDLAAHLPISQDMVEAFKVIKIQIRDMVAISSGIKLWIQLSIPRIEDGNNFGVSVQEETISELSRAEESGFVMMDNISKYYAMRGKLQSKVAKYPNLEDYHVAIRELDAKEYESMKLVCREMRNSYLILYDMILKNLDKIKTPKSAHNTALLY